MRNVNHVIQSLVPSTPVTFSFPKVWDQDPGRVLVICRGPQLGKMTRGVVLVSWSSVIKYHRLGGLSTVLEAGSPNSRSLQDWVFLIAVRENLFLAFLLVSGGLRATWDLVERSMQGCCLLQCWA